MNCTRFDRTGCMADKIKSMLMDMTMHKDDPVPFDGSCRIEVITSVKPRMRWTTSQKVAIVKETMRPGQSVSSAARQHGIAPNMLFAWKRRMTEGGTVAVATDDLPPPIPSS